MISFCKKWTHHFQTKRSIYIIAFLLVNRTNIIDLKYIEKKYSCELTSKYLAMFLQFQNILKLRILFGGFLIIVESIRILRTGEVYDVNEFERTNPIDNGYNRLTEK